METANVGTAASRKRGATEVASVTPIAAQSEESEIELEVDPTLAEDAPRSATPSEPKKSKIDSSGNKCAFLLALLECPVCLDYPRGSPIYICKHGHLVCNGCYSGVAGKCPTCRNTDLSVSVFASRIADLALETVSLPCRFTYHGCQRKDRLPMLAAHEERCQHRDVRCPSRHRGACPWEGSLSTLVAHVKIKGCIQLLRSYTEMFNSQFASFVQNFSPELRISVFDRSVCTHWKPVLLVSRHVVQYLIYLTIRRSAKGDWYLQVRSFSPRPMIDRIRVQVNVFKSSIDRGNSIASHTAPSCPDTDKNTNNQHAASYTYNGPVMSDSLAEDEILASGNYLLLRDAQIKPLGRGSAIFEYSVRVRIENVAENTRRNVVVPSQSSEPSSAASS